jgi:hypothetical protein
LRGREQDELCEDECEHRTSLRGGGLQSS